MSADDMRAAQEKAVRVYCIIGLLKQLAEAQEDSCLVGTLETCEAMMDDVTSFFAKATAPAEIEVTANDTYKPSAEVIDLFEALKKSIARGTP